VACPEQAVVLPVTERALEYADSVVRQLKDAGVRARADSRPEKIGLKIREAEMQKLPYMLIVGDRESQSQTVSLRAHGGRTWVHKRSRMSRPESGRPAVRKTRCLSPGNLTSEERSHGDA